MMDTYHGHVRTPADAIKLFEACRLGLLPRVQRRLSEKERQSIKSGSVFVWDEREAGMRRWTDGKSWSASRVSGSFLTYREMEGKRGGGQFIPPPPPPVRRSSGKTPDSGRGSDEDDIEGPDGYRYKPDGLMKQSFSITNSSGQHLHLISYFSRPHPNAPDLPTPTSDPQLRHIVPPKGMYPESTVHEAQGPAVIRSPMQQGPYIQQPHHGVGNHPSQRAAPYAYSPPSYGWPPSPVSTPPYHGYPSPMHGYNPGLPHPPPHHSPYPQPMHNMMPQGMSQGYDRPSPQDNLPPPLSHPRGMSTATAAQQGLVPAYNQSSSQAALQARIIAEQASIAQRALQSAPMIDPRITSPPTTLPPVQLPAEARPTTPPKQNGTVVAKADTPTSTGRVSPRGEASGTTATSIPSISHLVHATDSAGGASDNKTSNGERAGSKSPKSGESREKPKDIPHDKLNIGGEDQRAIRVLDRKFMI